MPVRFSMVEPGIFRGGEPSIEDLPVLRDVFNIKHIISLDKDIGESIAPTVEKLGIKHTILPISGSEQPLSYLKSNIINLIDSIKPVYIHCRHGSDRTGLAIALYRRYKNNWDPKSALEEANSFDFGDKLDSKTKKLYLTYLLGDINEADDAVTRMRKTFDSGEHAPAFDPQMSFAPYIGQNVPNLGPQPSSGAKENRSSKIRKLLMQVIEMLSDTDGPDVSDSPESGIPQVGGYDNCCGGIRGAGPVENSGFLNL